MIKEGMFNADPCQSLRECFHVVAVSTIILSLGVVFYTSYMYGNPKTGESDPPLTKDDFTGDMAPIALGPCPGGFASKLCCVAYFCNCCLRLELYGKLQKHEESKVKTNMFIFVAIVLLGHVVTVSVAIYPLTLPKPLVHVVGILSLAI